MLHLGFPVKSIRLTAKSRCDKTQTFLQNEWRWFSLTNIDFEKKDGVVTWWKRVIAGANQRHVMIVFECKLCATEQNKQEKWQKWMGNSIQSGNKGKMSGCIWWVRLCMVWCKNERHQFNYDIFKEFLQIAFALQKYKPPYSIIMLSTILQVNERKR